MFGDIVDQVRQVKLWASDPATGVVSDTVVTEYRYDVDGKLREVWDPRVSGPNLALNKTATGSTPCAGADGYGLAGVKAAGAETLPETMAMPSLGTRLRITTGPGPGRRR